MGGDLKMPTIRARVRVKLRQGEASTAAPALPSVAPGTLFEALGPVTGERVAGNDQWYELEGDRFVWAGGFEEVQSADDPVDPDADRPDRNRFGDDVPPVFETVAGVAHAAQGARPNGLEGLIVHFDAFRIRAAGNGAEDSDRRSIQMINSGKANGFHYLEISRTGKIFLPDAWSWSQWGSHAGQSLCPATGRTGVSRFYAGAEMNNPGMLFTTSDPNVLVPWYNTLRNSKGVTILDGQGHATRLSANDEWYKPSEARLVKPAEGSIKVGWYLPYSHAQFEALTNLCLHLARKFSSFSLDKVFGHDEVAPNRKNDPGGALANPAERMTMKEFRAFLKSRL
jgi:N-acetyl-anhydromuramyl-L-alanine amidase AmpD